MAIDTAEKRKSAAGLKRIAARVTPNSAKDAEWRQQVARAYSGIAVGAADEASNIPPLMWQRRRRREF